MSDHTSVKPVVYGFEDALRDLPVLWGGVHRPTDDEARAWQRLWVWASENADTEWKGKQQ